ncbi:MULTISPECIES: HlyD family efflux transporter periplasmic adaptor subunit [unclassified Neptuniibacter]|uniref:efflux RND transporter periplasmic adaptor subunit n=1 Tax=unclassified Neptuniibacter TaxID=2630693 RepID=UPI000C6717C9|nr:MULTISPECIES: HlyD family efflux transporter periplasmic adaptor subunit [unclassified Neptuniibacter]MAY43260.1 secretion protein HlyD [Oceanospirillaceae bacterium]|tara:strand:- start:12518 stop:13807 length:1290 start_codon:yes stop_codon:yes gene_type:complete
MSKASTKQPSHLKWILPIVIIIVAIATFALLKMNKPKAASQVVAEKVWSVTTITAAPGLHQPSLSLYGKVESPRMSNVTAAVTAFVREVYTDEGRKITPNDLLIQLDDSDVLLTVQQRQADVDNLLAQIETEKIRYNTDLKALKIEKNLQQLSYKTVKRYENLIKRKLTSQEKLDAARRDYQQQALSLTQREQAIADHPNRLQQLESQRLRATSLLDAAKLDLSRTQIKAPFIGRVAGLSVAPGDRVRAGDPLLELYSLDRLEVRAQIPNRILPLLRDRKSEKPITARGLINGEVIELELDRIAAEVSNGRAGVDALFKINNTDDLPETGRSIEISVDLPEIAQVIPVPPTALYGLDRVYRIIDSRLEAVQVTRIGDSIDQNGKPIVLISSPNITSSDTLVITQLPNAITGLRVNDISKAIVEEGTIDE